MHAPSGRTESRPPTPFPRSSARFVNRVALGGAGLAAAAAYALAHARHPWRPDAPVPGQGWWAAYDQGRYLRAALAWASGDLDPARHWYLPGYPLLGAPFAGLTPADPFLLPDLACLLASLWLTAALAARLAPGWRHATAWGAAAFLGVALLSPAALDAWVVPWTSTLSAPLALACLVAAASLSRRLDMARAAVPGAPGTAAPAFAAGLFGAAAALARPTDAAVLLAAVGAVLLAQALLTRPGVRPAAAAVLAGSAGAACGALLALVPYVAVHGWARSEYLAGAARYGFEWRLLPLRWVVLVLSPRPLFPDGLGMAEAFPWFLPGVAGMAACLAAPPGRGARWTHALVVAAATAQAVFCLAYRDLHPQGLWRYGNHHYFKWLLPLLGLYALLLAAVAARRRRAGLAAAAALFALVPWRAELVPLGPVAGRVEADGTLVLPPVRLGVHDAVLAGAEGTFPAVFQGVHSLRVGERAYEGTADFKLFPRPSGLMLMPLRPLGAGPVRLVPAPGVALRPGAGPILARARVAPGLPCWSGSSAPRCRPAEPIPPPPLPAGGVLRFDGSEAAFLGEGWSGPEPGGRWTEGARAVLRLPVPGSGPALVTVRGDAFVPPGAAPLGLRLLADGESIGARRIGAGGETAIEARLPIGESGEGGGGSGSGAVTLVLEFDAPRRPRDTVPGSDDARPLGLFVRSVTVGPRP